MRQNKRCWKAVISLSDKKTIYPGAVIGIIGGGQLGKMMAVAAKQMGYKVAVVDPVKDSPCGQIADIEITAQYNDREAIQNWPESVTSLRTNLKISITRRSTGSKNMHIFPREASCCLSPKIGETEKGDPVSRLSSRSLSDRKQRTGA